MRDICILPFTKDQVVVASDYCQEHSTALPPAILEQIEVTDKLSKDEVVMAPSPAQCAWLLSFTQVLAPSRSRSIMAQASIS